MLDFVLYVLLGAIVIVQSVWAGIVSVRSLPKGESHSKHTIGMVTCGFLALALTCTVGLRTWSSQRVQSEQQRASAGQLVEANQKLDAYKASFTFIQGQLSGLSMLVRLLDSTRKDADANLARQLQQISSEARRISGSATIPVQHSEIPEVPTNPSSAKVDSSTLQRLSNFQLRGAVLAFSGELRRIHDEQERNIDSFTRLRVSPRDPRSSAALKEIGEKYMTASRTFNSRVINEYLGPATNFRDELLRRLGPQPPAAKPNYAPTFWDGPTPIPTVDLLTTIDTASYLEKLAGKLPG